MPSSITSKGHSAEKLKQLYQLTEGSSSRETVWVPFFCAEARIDFNDVRTGLRATISLSKALEIYSDKADLLWTDDMIRDIDLEKTTSAIPDGMRPGILPSFVDANFIAQMENQFVQYLLRSFEVKIFRNFDLKIYSFLGESQDAFCNRCLEMFDGPRRQDLDKLHEIFNRKLEQARQRYLSGSDTVELELAKSESRNKDAFSRSLEHIADIFYRAELRMNPVLDPSPYSKELHELEERLLSLEAEAVEAITHLSDTYVEKARAIDEYIIHPNLKDIHFVRSCILWISTGAA
jgi:hypothetical protein